MNEFVNIAALVVAFFVGLSIGYVAGYKKIKMVVQFANKSVSKPT